MGLRLLSLRFLWDSVGHSEVGPSSRGILSEVAAVGRHSCAVTVMKDFRGILFAMDTNGLMSFFFPVIDYRHGTAHGTVEGNWSLQDVKRERERERK